MSATWMMLLVTVGMSVTLSASAADEPAPATDAHRFDGTWGVTLTCADFKDAGPGARGYTFRFLATVKDGVLHGEHGRAGSPSWLAYQGRVNPDGTAEIQAKGLTGSPDHSVAQVSRGTPYAYRMKGQFTSSRGSATRIDLRPCEAVFVKQ